MNICILGANGFLGSSLVKRFLSNGDKVYAISLHTYRLTDVLPDIQFSCCGLLGLSSVEPRIKAFYPDVVIHCAWDGGNAYASTQHSSQFYKNVPSTADLMEIIKRCNAQHFVGIGSGAEYGDQSCSISETCQESPNNLYGICKYMTKMYSQKICEMSHIKWTWVRPFYTYGPNDVLTRLIPSVINRCLKKEEVLVDECKSVVDYLYIDDFVDGMSRLVKNSHTGIFNVCSGKEYLVKNIVSKIAELTDNTNNVKFGAIPERTLQPKLVSGLSSKLKVLTDWNPTISIDEGLKRTIEFYKENL